jgi:large subunit ribosomal protein L18e
VNAIIQIKKTNPETAKLLAMPKKKWAVVNLSEIKKDSFIPGKVLSSGELEKAVKVVAWSASEKAIEKIKKAKCEFVNVVEEIKKNPELKGLEVLR